MVSIHAACCPLPVARRLCAAASVVVFGGVGAADAAAAAAALLVLLTAVQYWQCQFPAGGVVMGGVQHAQCQHVEQVSHTSMRLAAGES